MTPYQALRENLDFSLLKLIHVTSAIFYCGTLFNSTYWGSMALRSGRSEIAVFVLTKIRQLDHWITLPSWLILLTSGITNVLANLYELHHAWWVIWGFNFGIASGAFWFWPARKLRTRLQADMSTQSLPEPGELTRRRINLWQIWSVSATLLPLLALLPMIFKW